MLNLCSMHVSYSLYSYGRKHSVFLNPESEIRFGWGISYNYIGQMHHNLHKYDVVVGLEIPDFRVIPKY